MKYGSALDSQSPRPDLTRYNLYYSCRKNITIKIFGKLYKIDISKVPYLAEERESMDIPRYGHALIHHKNMIFAIGGSDNLSALKTVEVYFPSKDYWEEIEPLQTAREDVTGCVANERIYIFSVNLLHSESNTIEYLDTSIIYNSWVQISLKLNNVSFPKTVSCCYHQKSDEILILEPKTRRLWELPLSSDFTAFRLNIKSPLLQKFLQVVETELPGVF
ncbi:unnamed protein product [Moneuplotes crassus]|uniref:Uncharacterized protein n=1 Tax=Euplotes crassus TaxID=5936 RepID=A0AAD1UQE1_EUPCR|nr:unnamed protein product [Moneuplotes crassus]